MEIFFDNLYQSVQHLPGLLTVLFYLIAMVCIITGLVGAYKILKKKSHKKIKWAFFKMFFGGFLFCIPAIFEGMLCNPVPCNDSLSFMLIIPFLVLAIATAFLPSKPKEQKNED
ncbi:MAG: hypothetical protein R3E13_12050 [Alphaproteobacteria bacterium]